LRNCEVLETDKRVESEGEPDGGRLKGGRHWRGIPLTEQVLSVQNESMK